MFVVRTRHCWVWTSLLSLCLGCCVGGCGDSHTAKGAREGAAVGAISGAVGGLVSGLVFGGDPLDRAARGAVYAGTTGAVAGGIAGSRADKRVKEQQRDNLAQLRRDIGEDSFLGLTALAECRHDEALRYAARAQGDENPNYALAGLWLEVLTHADQRNESRARNLFPTLVEKDWDIRTESQAEATMRDTLSKLMDLRAEHGLSRICL